MQKQIVMVSGAPGAGKTTIAVPLAAALRFPLLAKDQIKESLHDALGSTTGDLQESRRLGGASMELMWTLAAYSPDVVLEANFRPHSRYERERLIALGAHRRSALRLPGRTRRYPIRSPSPDRRTSSRARALGIVAGHAGGVRPAGRYR